MKIRNDFVSNSSSTSFICYIDKNYDIDKYKDKFDELLKETVNSDKLFEHAIINYHGMEEGLKDLLFNIQDEIVSLDDIHYNHDININDDKIYDCICVKFPDLLYVYMMNPQYKDMIKSSCIMFMSNSVWDNCCWECEENFDYLQKYLTDSKISYNIRNAHV